MVHTLWKEAKTNKRFKTQGYYIMSIKIYMFRVSNMKMKPVFLNLLAYVSCYKKKNGSSFRTIDANIFIFGLFQLVLFKRIKF